MATQLPSTGAAVDTMFRERACAALRETGQTALEFLAANPGLSKVQLAQRLNRGANATGFVAAVYMEAVEKAIVRAVARDLLVRQIRSEYPHGWTSCGDVHPSVKIGSWSYEIVRYAGDPQFAEYSDKIIRDLAVENLPSDGWSPPIDGDALIDSSFERHWPGV